MGKKIRSTKEKVKRTLDKDEQYKPIRLITHNFQKYSKSTLKDVLHGKGRIVNELLRKYVPDIYLLQEITDASLFKQNVEKDNFMRYFVSEGPTFTSGNYSESYPLIFNPTTIHIKPTAHMEDGRPLDDNELLNFSIKDELPRPNILYKVKIPTCRYNLRPASKRTGNTTFDKDYSDRHTNLKHRKDMEYMTLCIIPVHTSPSLSISKQCDSIGTFFQQSNEELCTLAAGDFYAEKGAKRFMRANEGNIIMPNEPTNYIQGNNENKSGQRADMFMAPNSVKHTEAKVVTIPELGIHEGEDYLSYKIDHTPVETTMFIPYMQETRSHMVEEGKQDDI